MLKLNMSKNYKKSFFIRLALALIIMSSGLIWLVRNQRESLQKVLTVLPKFSIQCLIFVILLDCLQILFMAIRFWLLYPKDHQAPLQNVFSAMSMGQTLNAFLPARAGDVYKVAVLTPKPARPDFTILTLTGILTADKLVDLTSFLVLIFAFGSYKESSNSLTLFGPNSWKWILLIIATLLIFWPILIKKHWVKVKVWLFDFFKGFKNLLSPKQLFFSLGFAVLVWIVEAKALQQLSLYQNYALSLTQCFFVLTVLNLAIAVPISVANIGPFEASIAFALKKLGMPLESALAIATVHHGLQVLSYVITGGVGWLFNRIKSFAGA